MRQVRMWAALLALAMVAGLALAQAEKKSKAEGKPRPERPGRRVYGGAFLRLKGLSDEQRGQLAALWTESRKKDAAARAQGLKALEVYHERGMRVLTDAQRNQLAELRAAREARLKAAGERKPAPEPREKPTPRPALGVRGPLAELEGLTEDQVKKINALAAARSEARSAAMAEMRKQVEAAEAAYQKAVERVLTKAQQRAFTAVIEKAKAEREAAAKKAADERRRRTFGGDFRRLKGLTDEQTLALGQLWREAQEAQAAASKAAEAAREEYDRKGKRLLTPEQLKALEELTKPTPKPEPKKKAA